MVLHLPTLLVAGTVLVLLAAAAMTLFGLTRRVYRGYVWWSAAAWLAGAGVALLWLDAGSLATLAGRALLLQWPIVTLMGVRRFHARQPLPGSASMDLLALLAALGLALGVGLAGNSDAVRTAGFAGGSALLHAYAAVLVAGSTACRDSAALRTLSAGFALTAAALGGCAVTAWEVAAGGAERVEALTAATLAGVPALLLMPVVALLLTHERIERELRDSRRRLQFLANIDMLTRVPNRRHFNELARRALEREAPGTMSVLMFDIDHFKQINDRMGHAAGDRALRLVARCMHETLRAHDVAGRHGGDEFALLLPSTSVAEAMCVAARIVARAQTLAAEEDMPHLSLSFGVVQAVQGETVDEALRRADQALYEAKRQGRGRAVVAFGDEDEPVFTESQRLGLTPL
jgi:diguanylate cyclase (GGDEF)-like protein